MLNHYNFKKEVQNFTLEEERKVGKPTYWDTNDLKC